MTRAQPGDLIALEERKIQRYPQDNAMTLVLHSLRMPVDGTEARKSAAPDVGQYPKRLRFFANCDERTNKLIRSGRNTRRQDRGEN
jgi:hypothetical protein